MQDFADLVIPVDDTPGKGRFIVDHDAVVVAGHFFLLGLMGEIRDAIPDGAALSSLCLQELEEGVGITYHPRDAEQEAIISAVILAHDAEESRMSWEASQDPDTDQSLLSGVRDIEAQIAALSPSKALTTAQLTKALGTIAKAQRRILARMVPPDLGSVI